MPHETSILRKLFSSCSSFFHNYTFPDTPLAALIWLPLFLFWFLVGSGFFYLFPLSVLSGRILHFFLSGEVFSNSFSIRNAGWALDQPTIGKYLLCFALFSCLSIPLCLVIRRFRPKETRLQNMIFSAGIFLVAFWALSILSWPASLLFQYIHSMGFTFMRAAGILVAFGSTLAWIFWAVVMSRRESDSLSITLTSLLALAGPVIIWIACFL